MKNLKVEIIANSGFANLNTEFEVRFAEANKVSIATAFITHTTIGLIRNYLKNSKEEEKTMQLIVGLYAGFNTKKDLQELIAVAKKYPDNFSARISRHPLFHWKYYSFITKNSVSSYVGSSNFTSSGLNNPGELSVKLSGGIDASAISILNNEFRKTWEKESIDILKFPIAKYHSRQAKLPETPGFKLDSSIKRLLYARKRNNIKKALAIKSKCYVDVIWEYASKETKKSLYKAKSNWEKKNYEFLCTKYKSVYKNWKKADYILLYTISGLEKSLVLTEVMDFTEQKIGDDKYFVAIKRVKGTGIRKLNAERTKASLKAAGLKNNGGQNSIFLNEDGRKKVFELFK